MVDTFKPVMLRADAHVDLLAARGNRAPVDDRFRNSCSDQSILTNLATSPSILPRSSSPHDAAGLFNNALSRFYNSPFCVALLPPRLPTVVARTNSVHVTACPFRRAVYVLASRLPLGCFIGL